MVRIFALVVASFMGLVGILVAKQDKPSSLTNKALEHQQKIRRGKIRIQHTTLDQAGTAQRRTEFTLWFDLDKGKFRKDLLVKDETNSVKPYRRIECSNCEKPGYNLVHNEITFAKGKQSTPITLSSMADRKQVRVLDPRLIGFLPEDLGLLSHFQLETLLDSKDPMSGKIRHEKVIDRTYQVLSFDTPKKQQCEYWIDVERDHAVVKVSLTRTKDGKVTGGVVENELALIPSAKIWFPKKTTFSTIEGDTITPRSVTELHDVELNQPLDGNLFMMAGVKLRKGLLVVERSSSGDTTFRTWDGSNLSEDTPPPFVTPTLAVPTSRTPYVIVAVVCLLLAMLAVFFYVRSKKPPASPSGGA